MLAHDFDSRGSSGDNAAADTLASVYNAGRFLSLHGGRNTNNCADSSVCAQARSA